MVSDLLGFMQNFLDLLGVFNSGTFPAKNLKKGDGHSFMRFVNRIKRE
jgi:hypothetical protein